MSTEVQTLGFMSEEEYHGRRGEFLSSHLLGDFRKSPRLYERTINGDIKPPTNESRAFRVGRALHKLTLEGMAEFERIYADEGPINEKTGKPYGRNTQKFSDFEDSTGLVVLGETDSALIHEMDHSVKTHPKCHAMFDATYAVEAVVRREYCGRQCQIRMDYYSPDFGIMDLKTCDDLTWFESDSRRFGYANQLAFYRAILADAMCVAPEDIPCRLVGVEKKEPHRCGVWDISADLLFQCQTENEAAIKRIIECEAAGVFPTGYEETRFFG